MWCQDSSEAPLFQLDTIAHGDLKAIRYHPLSITVLYISQKPKIDEHLINQLKFNCAQLRVAFLDATASRYRYVRH